MKKEIKGQCGQIFIYDDSKMGDSHCQIFGPHTRETVCKFLAEWKRDDETGWLEHDGDYYDGAHKSQVYGGWVIIADKIHCEILETESEDL